MIEKSSTGACESSGGRQTERVIRIFPLVVLMAMNMVVTSLTLLIRLELHQITNLAASVARLELSNSSTNGIFALDETELSQATIERAPSTSPSIVRSPSSMTPLDSQSGKPDNPLSAIEKRIHRPPETETIEVTATTSDVLPSPLHAKVVCYGDSLTAGVNEPKSGRLTPYAHYLEEAITGELPERGRKRTDGLVGHLGLPGWTAEEMVAHWNQTRYGLGAHLDKIIRRADENNDEIAIIVLILAGTNDLRRGPNPSAEEILANIRQLHEAALSHPKVDRTLAINIPSAGFAKDHPSKKAVLREVNEGLLEFALSNPRVRHQKFPFHFREDSPYWASDRLHFSVEGYQLLGKVLARGVQVLMDRVLLGGRRREYDPEGPREISQTVF